MFLLVFHLAVLYFFPIRAIASGVDWVEYKGLWYYISDGEMVDYTEATTICDSMNAHLAVIATYDQNNFIVSKTDGIDRWIGLSNKRSNHNSSPCGYQSFVWNSDWNCTNDFNEGLYLLKQASPACMAYTTNFGTWALRHCFNKFGYICQWECKRFYLNLNYVDGNLSGIYDFQSYFNRHAVYTKRGSNNQIRIYKINFGDKWFIHDDDWTGYWRAKTSSILYVPYNRDLAWTNINGAPIISTTFCIECAALLMCVSPPIPELIHHCVYLHLNNTIPEYTNTEDNVFLKLHTNSTTCICSPTRTECGINCGYIFPYPNETTHLVIGGNTTVTFTNKCQEPQTSTTEVDDVETSNTERYYMSTEISKQTPTFISDISSHMVTLAFNNSEEVNNFTTIIASTLTVAIVILVIVIIVIVLRNKRNENKEAKSHSKSAGITNPRIGNINSNVYVEQDGPKQVDSLVPAYAESPFDGNSHNEPDIDNHYTYVASSPKEHNDNTENSIYCKEKQADGYLAPDYGVLSEQDTLQPKQHIHEAAVYSEVNKTKSSRHKSEFDSDKKKDPQVHDNDSRYSGSINASNEGKSDNNVDTKDTTDFKYYNIEKKDNVDDDDLELFENNVYNQT